MKTGKFTALVYRELYLARKSWIGGIVSFLLAALICWLILLSYDYGNIGKILSEVMVSGDGTIAPDVPDIIENMRRSMYLFVQFLPAVMSMQFFISASDIAAKDTLTCWCRFEHCTPVTPMRFAAVKLALNVLLLAVSFALGATYMYTVGLVSGYGYSYSNFSMFMLIYVVLSAFCIISQIFVLLLKNRDKGMLATMAVVVLPLAVLSFINGQSSGAEEENTFDTLINAAETLCPYTPLIISGMLILLFAAMYFLYKRREK